MSEINDLRSRRQELVSEIQEIESQLSDRDRHNADGERMTDSEYHHWRRSAIGARLARLKKLRALNEEIKEASSSDDAGDNRLARIEEKVDRILTLIEDDEEPTDVYRKNP